MPVTHAQQELSFCPSWTVLALGTLVSLAALVRVTTHHTPDQRSYSRRII